MQQPADNAFNLFFTLILFIGSQIRLDVSSESSAEQRIHIKYQVFFSPKKNSEEIFKAVVLRQFTITSLSKVGTLPGKATLSFLF